MLLCEPPSQSPSNDAGDFFVGISGALIFLEQFHLSVGS